MNNPPTYKHFLISEPFDFVRHVQINRPGKLNSFHQPMWIELRQIFEQLSLDPNVRTILLSGTGERAFTTGLDVQAAAQSSVLGQSETIDGARRALFIRRHIAEFQDCISTLEKCEKPVICVMHGFTYGLGMDICTCADIRICSADVKFAVKEVDIGLAADIGTLTRLPKVVGNFGWVKDVSLTARTFGADEAYRVGFVSHVRETKAQCIEMALELAVLLASKSPVAVQGTKELLNHARDHSVADSLRYTGLWNSAALQTSDVERALLSGMNKTRPTFEKL
ncbi:BgTH12-06562 [Blumeria graminis f. sp. triticale]|uniref:3-hydroxyisobutyryl-CoA hydrolase n=3 Tax=Blumeria graminis TaxID=34373 RepID=A0A061HL83_BLUGR|nr:3-hydroxyisobutyryl-CoA hydrolase [Blumeria graminis f. sp. tritici 96224]CAD6500857.1 BgTH12-06562 [Blumeria graminis f. sp. triticale]VCU41153.1 Bgt-235 [Blumeria graminis f. sp. tritici]